MEHRAKQNHHPTRESARGNGKRLPLRLLLKNRKFSVFNIFYVFIFLFPLIVFGFSGEMKVSQFYCCLMHQMLEHRCYYKNAVLNSTETVDTSCENAVQLKYCLEESEWRHSLVIV